MAGLILAGDVGGTNTRLGLFSLDGGRPRAEAVEVFASAEHPELEEIVVDFMARHQAALSGACVGIAGPVRDNQVYASNLPWVITAEGLARPLGLRSVLLINDLEANAHGLPLLGPEDFAVLHEGEGNGSGTMALVSAGTGLGEASIPRIDHGHWVVASEGGHADFAPRNELEIGLLRFLLREHERISYERVLSGMGLWNIYRFLRDTGRGVEEAWLSKELADGDRPAAISGAALAGRSKLCVESLELFVSIYGAEAGNVALKFLSSGGVFLGGGIAPKILSKLKEPEFMRSFLAKGRLRPFLESVPVRVILNDKTALWGAARKAFLAAGGSR
ncbi:MAG TPA: glucokinase [Elusimicrobiota bacterium]|nr:glucokinase [Elusimicrobiota bacterium]